MLSFHHILQTLILHGVAAIHINDKDNAESLRSKFVKHEGKKALTVRRDHFVLGKSVNDWGDVVAEFHEQIGDNIIRCQGLRSRWKCGSAPPHMRSSGGAEILRLQNV